ncbi:hypothetical protein CTheo_5214 [Ceratobasidium theobromae]|uniref:Uncharacterized protein n=1 Tax=Ceratobasidium theobromae TaxID=1582974 RepID=A0A5N5QIP2_9AGAM|nr:hypothetical protein CTheo_5214 [Ceratobasidium theobromae]
MPDQYQEYAYLSYSSPSGSSDSPTTSTVYTGGGSGTVVGFTSWTQDHELDALYECDPDALALITDEELFECLSIPMDGPALPETQGQLQSIPPYLVQGMSCTQGGGMYFFSADEAPDLSIPHVAGVVQNRVPPLMPSTVPLFSPHMPPRPTPTEPIQLPSPFQPREARALPPLTPVQPTLPPSPPDSSVSPHHPRTSFSATSGGTPYWPSVPPSGERQRLAFPAPGDLSYSSCEAIM